MGTSLIPWFSLLLVPFTTSSPNKFQFTRTRQYIAMQAETTQWVTHTTCQMVLHVLNVTAKLCLYNVLSNNIQQHSCSPTSSNIIRIYIAKERSYSCLLQLSNIIPLRTVTSAPYVQYHFSETCSCVSKCPAGISYLWTVVYYTMHQTSAALLNLQCHVTKFPPHRYCCTWQLVTSAWHTFSCIWWP